jgi:peptidoglycan/LPS O-acetylase OafA/YrhL
MESEDQRPHHPSGKRLLQLDGLRALAIIGVMLHHFGVHPGGWLDWGPVAPSVFFMLSGFLITGSLRRMMEREGVDAWDLVGFHLRRLARLLPALYILLLVGWLAGLEEYREGLVPHAFFASNIHMALAGEWAGSLSHLWSLSMQEQFYLLWPLLLLLPRRFLPAAIACVALLGIVFRASCLHLEAPEMFRWLMLPGSLDAFAAGGLLALAIRAKKSLLPAGWAVPTGLLAAGCWVVARGLRHLDGTGNLLVAFVDTFEVLAIGWLIVVLIQYPGNPLARVLASRPLAAVGRISYGLFIWHMLVASALAPHLDAIGLSANEALALRVVVFLAASFLIAALSWIAIEKPSNAWAARFAASPSVAAAAGKCRSFSAKVGSAITALRISLRGPA